MCFVALTLIYLRHAYNAILSLTDGKWTMDTLDQLPAGSQPQISVEELVAAEQIVKSDPQVQKYAKDVGEPFL